MAAEPTAGATPGPRYVLGIDAGGTKTVGLLADENGHVVSEARAGGANLATHGELQVEKVLDGVIESVVTREPVVAVCLGIAGVDRPSDEAVIRGILRRLGYRAAVRVVNDAVIALVAGAPERSGVVILAGTGSIAYAEHPSGRTARAGGYGYFLADQGSAYWLGHEALRAVVRAVDSRGPETQLTALVLAALGVSSVPDVVPIVYEKGLQRTEVARLAELVQQAADSGDGEAGRILDGGAQELILAGRSVARQVGFGDAPYRVVLAGGAFRACPGLVPRIRAGLGLPGAQPELLAHEPARGAVTLALDFLKG
jgi:N-acetylglucosamine kinase-like BadF-type ATPase